MANKDTSLSSDVIASADTGDDVACASGVSPMALLTNDRISTLYAKSEYNTGNYEYFVSDSTKARQQQFFNSVFNNPNMLNSFAKFLMNRIGKEVYRFKDWSNPLNEFKMAGFQYGNSIEEIGMNLIKARGVDVEKIKRNPYIKHWPDIRAVFHSYNRWDRYDTTIAEHELREAFNDEYGLSRLVDIALQVPYVSDQRDEYEIMKERLNIHYQNYGFWNVNVNDFTDASITNAQREDYVRDFTRKVNAVAGDLAFLHQKYNYMKLPSHTPIQDMLLITTPMARATIDVDWLASIYNLSKGEVIGRMIIIDEWPKGMNGTMALLMDKTFWITCDAFIEMRNIEDITDLSWNYKLHHKSLISSSPFANIIMFSTQPSSQDQINIVTKDSVTLDFKSLFDCNTGNLVKPASVKRGWKVQIYNTITGTITPNPDNETVDNVAGGVEYTIAGGGSAPVQLAPFTRIDQKGWLFVDPDEKNTVITVTGTTIIDGVTTTAVGTLDVPVVN